MTCNVLSTQQAAVAHGQVRTDFPLCAAVGRERPWIHIHQDHSRRPWSSPAEAQRKQKPERSRRQRDVPGLRPVPKAFYGDRVLREEKINKQDLKQNEDTDHLLPYFQTEPAKHATSIRSIADHGAPDSDQPAAPPPLQGHSLQAGG